MRKPNKKGFTIVELVIVIAVVAILAAVLIPTFVSVTKRANESKDTQLVRNLNTALAVDTEVGKHETMQSALEAAAKAGYDVAKINTSATDNEILWDSKNDCFVYKKDSGIEYIPNSVSEEQQKAVKNYQYWIIASAPDATYSTYLYDYKGSGTETVTTGLDVGNETVTSVNYTNDNGQEVTIRTNGGALEINAKDGSVNHYGNASVVTINEVAKNSYHEYGTIGEIKLAKGRVVVEKEASVGSVFVTAASIDDIKVENNGIVGGVAAKDNNVAGSLKNNVDGVNEDKIITSKVDNSKFAGGLGTEEAPYLIATGKEFGNISSAKEEPGYYKLIASITLEDSYTTIENFYGVLDGNGYTISRESYESELKIFGNLVNATIKNLVVTQGSELTSISEYVGYDGKKQWESTVIFENINVIQIEAVGTTMIGEEKRSSFASQVVAGDCYFKNCTVKGNFINASGVEYLGIFVGNYIGSGGGSNACKVSFDSCVFDGCFFSPNAGFLVGQGNGNLYNYTVEIKDCENRGVIVNSISSGVFGMTNESQTNVTRINNEFKSIVGNVVKNVNEDKVDVKIDQETKEIIIENGSTDYVYLVSFRQSATWYKDGKGFGSDYFIVKSLIENKSGIIKTGVYQNKVNIINEELSVEKGAEANWKYTYDETAGYNVQGYVSPTEYYIGSSGNKTPIVTVYAFSRNADGSLVVKCVYTMNAIDI